MEENVIMVPGSGTKVIVRDVKQEIETAFLDYSMSVIVSRALPDVRDGLKPVHRRILYTMHERGNDPSHPYRKSADTVGAVLGAYHPHGDASVYDAMVRLAQDFSLRYPLVDGQGNFGSVDGDPPAAYRYTEARMSKIACEMLTDIDKDTIDWDPNFDETKKEPHMLPSRFPNLLVNGSQGIAVGMATNIPPHNLREVVSGMIALIDDPEIDLAGLMEHIKGPDFPTGGVIMGRSGIRAAYATGRGKITLRGRAEIVEKKNGRYEIVITEIPYMVNKTRLIESIADLVKDKRIEGISDLNDLSSSRTGMKILVEIKKDANPQVVLNQLYRYTQLQDTVGVIMLALDDGVPKIMSLKTMMQRYLDFQFQVIRRRTAYELKKAQDREHILEGLRKAVDIVDEIIATIRACKGGFAEAKAAIMERFGFDDPQADAIVKLQLGRLAGLEILKIDEELGQLRASIENYKDILSNDAHTMEIVKTDLTALADKYGDDRRTSIEAVSGEVDIEDLIPEETADYVPTMLKYKTHADNGSMYNTPNCWAIYCCGKVFKYLKSIGGLEEMHKRNIAKAKVIYDFLDSSKMFHGTVEPEFRSLMNIPFVTDSAELDAEVVAATKAAGYDNLKGHKSVGGLRASVYNAMPIEGAQALVEFLKKFDTPSPVKRSPVPPLKGRLGQRLKYLQGES